MSTIEREIDYKGMSIKIYVDEEADSPASWDNPDAFLCSDYGDFYVHSECLNAEDCREVIERTGRWFSGRSNHAAIRTGFYIFPVSILNHSCLTLYLGECHGWDYSNGWAFVCVHRQKGWSWSKKQAEKIAEGVVETWNQYLHSDVYGFITEDEDEREIDSCWGFYGKEGLREAIEEAKAAIDCVLDKRYEEKTKALKNALRQHLAKRKAQIKHHVPLYARRAFVC